MRRAVAPDGMSLVATAFLSALMGLLMAVMSIPAGHRDGTWAVGANETHTGPPAVMKLT